MTALYLVHGWGFDASFWGPMRAHLAAFRAIAVDLGTFGPPAAPPLPDEPFLAVGHSAGSLKLLALDTPHCRGIVLLNGFPRFSAAPDFPQGVSPRVIERMRRRLQDEPEAVVTEFRARCGCGDPLPGAPQIAALDAGLATLLTEDRRADAARRGDRLSWMTGESDPLPPARAGFSTPGEIVPGGHLLPLEQPELCADFVKKAAASLG